MVTTNLSILISNIVHSKQSSNCRLCLKQLKDVYVPLDDNIYSLNNPDEAVTSQTLCDVINSLLDEEICNNIPALDAVCNRCAEAATQCSNFLESCNKSTNILHQILDNINENLDFNTDIISRGQSLYIMVNNHQESEIMLVDKTNRHCCRECNKEFHSSEELMQHNRKEHEFTCGDCSLTFTTAAAIRAHECVSCGPIMYRCPKCKAYKKTAESLQKHNEKIHTTYLCKDCGKPCIGVEKLKSHEEKHKTGNKNECPNCGKNYVTRKSFVNHVKLCLEGRIDPHPYRAKIEKTYTCEKCNKGYSTPGGLRVHERFVHGNAQPHVCEHCGKKFTAPSYLKMHMTKHTGEKKFKCNICGNNLVSKEALLYHVRRHTGVKPYSCKQCNEKFVNASARAEHIKFKHSAPKLSCNICSRKFYMSHFLKQHISRHHDPSSKLYLGRRTIPPNMPGEENMRVKLEVTAEVEED